jgi:hypothetical protein
MNRSTLNPLKYSQFFTYPSKHPYPCIGCPSVGNSFLGATAMLVISVALALRTSASAAM